MTNKEQAKSIQGNLENITKNIHKACIKSCRKSSDITLIAVTKNVEIEKIKILNNLSINNFGENKAQEFLQKYDKIENAKWHFIGNLQTNKVKYIIDKVELIHSVSSIRLLEEINRRAEQIQKNMDVLLEINIANEETKKGFLEQNILQTLKDIQNYRSITVKGLMCIAPFVEDARNNRQYFKKMNKLFVDIGYKNNDNINMKYLSMGMTLDYEIAIEEGSNMVRIGTGIFGDRNY